MPISIQCPTCGADFAAKDELAGKRVRCRSCQGVISVPAAKPTQPRASAPSGKPSRPPPASAKPRPAPAPSAAPDLSQLDPQLLSPPNLATPSWTPATGAVPTAWAQPSFAYGQAPPSRSRGKLNSAALITWSAIFAATALAGIVTVVAVRLAGLTLGETGIRVLGAVTVITFGVSVCVSFAGWLWLVILSHRDDELVQCLLIPAYALFYGFRTWKRSSFPASLCCGGLLPLVLLFSMLFTGSLWPRSRRVETADVATRSSLPSSRDSRTAAPATSQPQPSRPAPLTRSPTPAPLATPPRPSVGLVGQETRLSNGFYFRPPVGFLPTARSETTVNSQSQSRHEWTGPPVGPGDRATLTFQIRKGPQYSAAAPSHTTGVVTPNLDGVLIQVNGAYELRDSEVSNRQLAEISFLRASRQRQTPAGQQHILAYLAHHQGFLVEIAAVDGADRRWLDLMEQSIESLRFDPSKVVAEPRPANRPPNRPATPSRPIAKAPHVKELPGLGGAAGAGFRVFAAVVANGGERAVFVDQATRSFHVWDLLADKEIVTWNPYPDRANALRMAISAQGNVFAVHGKSEDPGIDAWDPETAKLLCHIPTSVTPQSICISVDGKLIAADQQTQGIGVWTVPDGREMCRLKTERWSDLLTLSADGRRLAAYYPPTNLDAWEIPSGKKIMHSDSKVSGLYVLNFSSQGDRLVAGGGGNGGVIVPVPSQESSPPGTDLRAIYGAAFLKGGEEVLLATTEMAEITASSTGKRVRQVPVGTPDMRPLTAYFSPDGCTALLCSQASQGIHQSWVWQLPP